MAEKNNISTSKGNAELIRFQFTDDTRQTLESVTVFLKDRFAEYGYLPETDVIPIEWISEYAKRFDNDRGHSVQVTMDYAIESMLAEWNWEKENEAI